MGVVVERWCPTQPVLGVFLMKMTDRERAYYEWRQANWKSMPVKTRLKHLWQGRWHIDWRRQEKYIEEEKRREIAKLAEQNRIRSEAEELQRSEAIRLSKSFIPKLDDLYSLSPQQFENEIARLFVGLGYNVRQTPYSNDYGRDAILQKNGKKILASM